MNFELIVLLCNFSVSLDLPFHKTGAGISSKSTTFFPKLIQLIRSTCVYIMHNSLVFKDATRTNRCKEDEEIVSHATSKRQAMLIQTKHRSKES